MKNVVEFPERGVVEEEAAEWLIRLDGDYPPTVDETNRLRDWIARSPAHREELVRLCDFWGKMNVLTELSVPLCKPRHGAVPRGSGGFPPLSRQHGLIAAVFLLVAASLFSSTPQWQSAARSVSSNGIYTTAVGEQQQVTLADGSQIALNTDSMLQVAYGESYRNVHLVRGEAHFIVSENDDWPFRVYAGDGRIDAIGTAFSVHIREDGVNVTVTEGRVSLGALRSEQAPQPWRHEPLPPGSRTPARWPLTDEVPETLGVLGAGQVGVIARQSANEASRISRLESLADSEISRRLSWREGFLNFSGESLENVVAEISRYTTVEIEITDPDVRSIRIGGRFAVGKTDAMLDALRTNFGLRVERLDEQRVLLSAAAK